MSEREKEVFEAFVMLERWRELTDVTCTISVEAATSMERENKRRLLPRSGSVMNPRFLIDFNEALRSLADKHRHDFKFLQLTNGGSAEDGAAELVDQILHYARG